jgi:hypothetical protein
VYEREREREREKKRSQFPIGLFLEHQREREKRGSVERRGGWVRQAEINATASTDKRKKR